jgi:hypothetical protein
MIEDISNLQILKGKIGSQQNYNGSLKSVKVFHSFSFTKPVGVNIVI